MILRGEAECVIFDDAGQVLSRGTLTPGGALTALELPPGVWHVLIARLGCINKGFRCAAR